MPIVRATITHERLWLVCRRLPEDYWPYGENLDREGTPEEHAATAPLDAKQLLAYLEAHPSSYQGDCSCGCVYYAPLAGTWQSDWGVCTNPASHRSGLLTFEHQGCPQFTAGLENSADGSGEVDR